ncbi:hypothetical protein B0H19DRAFT_1205890 [Mycena capillaripes]|nr:hypothetical protein B0H19DRAFT_1205890 [Mycena capillaripes]
MALMVPASGIVIALQFLLSTTTFVAGRNPKRGLPLVQGSESDLVRAIGGQCSWFYNWSPTAPVSAPAGLAFVPMQWGRENVGQFAETVRRIRAKTILGFNEPDLASQSNIPAAEAAQLWQQHIQPLKSAGVRLGSPAVSSAPNGLLWLASFMKACTGCTIDFIVVHWYGEGADNFSRYLASVHTQFPQHPVWVTEFADSSTNSRDITNFMTTALKYLDEQAWIEGYSWFAFAVYLLDGSGNLNALGTSYIAGSRARRGHARRRRYKY